MRMLYLMFFTVVKNLILKLSRLVFISASHHEIPGISESSNDVLLSIFGNDIHVNAQDDHYWSQQYGAESTLMGGAMVGGAGDNSAVYYNPGSAGINQ